MKLHPGLVVRINNEVVAAVSSENFNILSVQIHGDVLSPEIAILDMFGGYYGDPEETKHLIWAHDRELSASDEVEVLFQHLAASSHAGKPAEEVHPPHDTPADDQPLDMAELAGHLLEEPRLRDGFDIHVRISDEDQQVFSTDGQDYSFFVSIMWDWKSIDSAKLSVSSTTIQNVVEQKSGTQYLRRRLGAGQSVRVRIVSQ